MKELKIYAVKASAKIPETDLMKVEEFCQEKSVRCKRFNWGHLVVFDRYTFTFFKKGEKSVSDQHVNIKKLTSLNIESAIKDLAWFIDAEPNHIFYNVDNITAGSDLRTNIDLEKFILNNQDISDLMNYNPERFPGLFLRGEYGKVLLFKSGKMVFVGCKTNDQIEQLNEYMHQKCVNIWIV